MILEHVGYILAGVLSAGAIAVSIGSTVYVKMRCGKSGEWIDRRLQEMRDAERELSEKNAKEAERLRNEQYSNLLFEVDKLRFQIKQQREQFEKELSEQREYYEAQLFERDRRIAQLERRGLS